MHRMKKSTVRMLLLLGLILGCCRERVALFSQGDPKPLQIYPYQLEALPPADQEALRAGIPIENSEHLHRLLEDLLS